MMENWSKQLNFRDIAQKYGTPLYLFSPGQLSENIRQFLHLAESPENITFPVKACPSAPVLHMMAASGLSADCAAATEITMALEAGFPGSRIFYNSPEMSEDTATAVLRAGGVVVMNDAAQLVQFLRGNTIPEGNIYLRWNPDVAMDNPGSGTDIVAHGNHNSQFGSSSETILSLPDDVIRRITGLHTHIGSRMTSLEPFIKTLDKLHVLVDDIYRHKGHRISELNLGGGLKCPMNEDDVCPGITDLTTALKKVTRKGIRYVVEPGNAMTGNTMGLLTTVRGFKTRSNGRNAILDVGSNQLLKFTLAGVSLSILDSSGARLPCGGADAVVGPLCFAGDRLLPATRLEGVNVGDPLFVQHCGAYCISLAHHFNGRFRPAVLTIAHDGKHAISQASEDLTLTSAVSAGLIWNYDNAAPSEKPVLNIPDILTMPVDLLSMAMTGKRTFLCHLRCRESLTVLERMACIFYLSDCFVRCLYPGRPVTQPDTVVFQGRKSNLFTSGGTTALFFSVSHEAFQELQVSFGTKEELLGFCRMRIE